MELETQIILSNEFGYIDNPSNLLEKLNKVFALLNGLITNLRRKTTK